MQLAFKRNIKKADFLQSEERLIIVYSLLHRVPENSKEILRKNYVCIIIFLYRAKLLFGDQKDTNHRISKHLSTCRSVRGPSSLTRREFTWPVQ